MASRKKALNPEEIFEELYADSDSDMESFDSSSEEDDVNDFDQEVTPRTSAVHLPGDLREQMAKVCITP